MLVVSAHWLTPEQTLVDTQLKPKTIHDFGGFPPALFDVQYPAPGHPELARSAIAALAQSGARPSEEWGLDHGTWSVLRLLYPAADVPTFQVSIDYSKPPRFHWALGQALAALRTQGVLIIGSGNIVRNLRATDRSGRETDEASQPWAAQFDRYVQTVLAQRDTPKRSCALNCRMRWFPQRCPRPTTTFSSCSSLSREKPPCPIGIPGSGPPLLRHGSRKLRFGPKPAGQQT